MWKREFFARVLLCITSVCDFLISAVWRKLTNRWCASSSVWDCVKQVSETFEILKQAFGDSCKSCSQTFEWFGRFKNGRTLTANDDRSGRPSTAASPSKVVQVLAVVNQDRHRTIRDLCAEVGIGYGSCQRILTEHLNMLWIAAKFVPSVDPRSERLSSVDLSGSEGNCDKWSHTSLERNHRRWKHRLCLRPRDKTAIFAMEVSWVSKTQKSMYGKKQIEEDAYLFLWPRGDRTPKICPTWNDRQCKLLLWCSKKITCKCDAQEATEMVKPEPHYPSRQCPGSQVY